MLLVPVAGVLGGVLWASSTLGALTVAAGIAVVGWWALRREDRLASLGGEVERLGQELAARAQDLSRASADADQRAREADSLLEIALATGATLDEPELLGHIARGAARACRAGRCTILRLDETGTWVTPAVSQFADGLVASPAREDWIALGTVRLQGVPVLEEAVLARGPVVIADAGSDVRVPRQWVELFGLHAVLVVPLLRMGRAVGMLVLDYAADSGEDPVRHTPLAVALAEQVALALQNAGLYADAETRRREAEVMAEVVAAVNASLDVDTVLRRIAEGAQELCRSEVAAIALRDPASGAMLLRYRTGATASGDPIGRRLLGTDDSGEAHGLGEEYVAVMREEGLLAVVVVPIRSELGVDGLLYVGNHSPRPFSPRHKVILTRLAGHAAIAITNGRLFESARTRLARMTRLTALGQLMVTSLDYREVLLSATTAALDLLAADTARLWVLDEDAGRLRLAACEERGEPAARPPSVAELAAGAGLVGWVVDRRRERYTPDLWREPLLTAEERITAAGHTSQLAVPLVVGERAVGALLVLTRVPRTFTPEERELLGLFAAQAAAALQNARLYQRAQQAYDELTRTQQRLTHAQKMEAVGRLAGGVAHDFNNLLTVIAGRSELLLEELAPEHPSRDHAEQIERASARGAGLTHQLLAFSRQQILRPRVLDLNAAVVELERMLGRVIGEDIHVELDLDAGLGRVLADPSQVEQVLMNLAVNARDAMPRGGQLTFRTRSAAIDAAAAERLAMPAGPCVLLEVRDTGVGIDEATRLRIFEPFFTTKESGKGTGLGLATVYGIVRQSGGAVEVESEPGQGTAFRLFLLCADPVERPAQPPAVIGGPDTGDETILLLEDEAGVREMAERQLTARGYRVLAVAKCTDALELAERLDGPIDLLLTDVVLPQMSGPEVAARLGALRPGVKVLYVSGYTDDALDGHGVLGPGISFLAKPFTSAQLGRKVREVLDDPSAS
jgi:signal transduction histidine kinase